MSAPNNIDSTMRQSAPDQVRRELGQKEWRRPELRKLPIAATANSGSKMPGGQDDGNTKKVGDIQHLS
jgi:hypothetical protein